MAYGKSVLTDVSSLSIKEAANARVLAENSVAMQLGESA